MQPNRIQSRYKLAAKLASSALYEAKLRERYTTSDEYSDEVKLTTCTNFHLGVNCSIYFSI